MRHTITVLSVIALLASAAAQTPQKLNFELREHLRRVEGKGEAVNLFVRGEAGAVAAAVEALGGTVKLRMRDRLSVRMPADAVRALAQHNAVQGFEFNLRHGIMMNDSARTHNRVNPVHAGQSPLTQGYTGKDVVIGVIDQGCDWRHGDFQDSLGNTRIMRFWGQTYPFDANLTPQPYGYGQLWDSTLINANLCPASDIPGTFGHGSTVTGTAAGNGLMTGNCKGMAPEADIVVVAVNFNAPTWENAVLDGVKLIYDYAASVGKPAVINLSAGSYLGSHDGLDAATLFIDSLTQASPGRVFVCAAGNSGTFPAYHLRTVSDADTAFTWFRRNPTNGALGYPAVYFELWADSADMVNLQYAMGANDSTTFSDRGRTPFHNILNNLGGQITNDVTNSNGDVLGTVDFWAEQRGGQYHLVVHMQTPDSTKINWRFMTTGAGAHDIWTSSVFGISDMVSSNLPSAAVLPSIVHYVLPDNNQQIVDNWACSPNALTVANYHNEAWYIGAHLDTVFVTPDEGSIDPSSSRGPSRKGVTKPDIGATGAFTFSPGPLSTMALMVNQPNNVHKVHPDSLHMRNAGTSIASPVIAGVAALYLQRCPNATHTEVMAAIRGTAYTDQYTGAVPNNRFGSGKVDAFAAVSGGAPVPLSVAGNTAFCEGDSVLVSGPAGMLSYDWSTGSNDPQVYVSAAGPLSLTVESPSGCAGTSGTLVFVEHPLPVQPLIAVNGPLLECTPADSYQWILDGNPIAGANGQTHLPAVNGNYQVTITDANGCSATSDPLFVGNAAVQEMAYTGLALWPSPTTGNITVQLPTTSSGAAFRYEVHDADGRLVVNGSFSAGIGARVIELPRLANGLYALHLAQDKEHWVQSFLAE